MNDAFVRDGQLVRLPARHRRRRLVLERIAESFEPGRYFTEPDVNAVLRRWCAGGDVDHVTVRRYLVDEELLGRADGKYWRTGGRVDAT